MINPKIFTKVKYQCSALVLCRKMSIAGYPPKAPPKNDKHNNVFSFVLHLPFLALLLSTPYAIKVMMVFEHNWDTKEDCFCGVFRNVKIGDNLKYFIY